MHANYYWSPQRCIKIVILWISGMTQQISISSRFALTIAPTVLGNWSSSYLTFKAIYLENLLVKVCAWKFSHTQSAPLDLQNNPECMKFIIARYRDASKLWYSGFQDLPDRSECPHDRHLLLYPHYSETGYPVISLQGCLLGKLACKGIRLKI